jgi:anti-anti-sigma factor
MTTQTVTEGETIRLVVEGSVNSQTAESFEKALLPLVKEGKAVVVDFEKVDYLSSAGLRVLLEASNTVEKPENLKLVHVSKEVKDVFDMTGFSDLLTIE